MVAHTALLGPPFHRARESPSLRATQLPHQHRCACARTTVNRCLRGCVGTDPDRSCRLGGVSAGRVCALHEGKAWQSALSVTTMHLNLFVAKCRDLKNVDGSDDVFVEVQFRGVTERTETVEDGGASPGASCVHLLPRAALPRHVARAVGCGERVY